MPAAPTFQDLYNAGKAEAVSRRPALGVREGDVSDMLLAGGAAMVDRGVGYSAERFDALYLDGARGADLTKLADDRYGVQRVDAVKAVATVTITRAGATVNPASYPVGTVVATERDALGQEVRFLTTQIASWLASENGAKTVAVQAEVAGRAGNVAVNKITRIISSSPGEGTYSLTASTVGVGGAEEETDEALRERCRGINATREKGTFDALEVGAQEVALVKRATAVEDATGLVTVYVTDENGNSTGTTKTVSESVIDDGTMTAKVAIELLDWIAAGALVNVTGGALQTVNITLQLTVRLGVDVAGLVAAVQDAVEAAVARLQIGETLYKSYIQAAARLVDPDNILEVTVLLPLVDTAPSTPGSIIRAGTVSVS